MIRDEGARVTIVRPGWIYGPRDTASFARVARMIDQGRMRLIGSGDNHLPLIHASDVVDGLLLACAAEQAEGGSYLLVNDQPVTQRDFLGVIASALGVPAPTRRIPYVLAMVLGGSCEHLGRLARRRQPPPVMRYGLQLLGGDNRFVITRARTELGFSPQIGLSEGIASSIAWYRDAYGAPTAVKVPA
jgi:nucleoside-diphosphate-sugar epimerase